MLSIVATIRVKGTDLYQQEERQRLEQSVLICSPQEAACPKSIQKQYGSSPFRSSMAQVNPEAARLQIHERQNGSRAMHGMLQATPFNQRQNQHALRPL
eukprot:728872-Pelagomonas_calceolata.AAC.5